MISQVWTFKVIWCWSSVFIKIKILNIFCSTVHVLCDQGQWIMDWQGWRLKISTINKNVHLCMQTEFSLQIHLKIHLQFDQLNMSWSTFDGHAVSYSWLSVLLVGENRRLRKLTVWVVIGTDYIGRCKSNYHTIMTTTVSIQIVLRLSIGNIWQLINII
jgi:hypothetical protein